MIPILSTPINKEGFDDTRWYLAETTRCIVTEERNGMFECEFDYPLTGEHFNKITYWSRIIVPTDALNENATFVVYGWSKSLSGTVTFRAYHKSYMLKDTLVEPFFNNGLSYVLSVLEAATEVEGSQWHYGFTADYYDSRPMNVLVPTPIREVINGMEGSMVETYDPEIKWRDEGATFYRNRGSDKGYRIAYGKNLISLELENDNSEAYRQVLPYWYDEQNEDILIGDVIWAHGDYPTGGWRTTIPLDASAAFDEKPSKQDLEIWAEYSSGVFDGEPERPYENITINFVDLRRSPEYSRGGYSDLEDVLLCDTVTIDCPQLGVDDWKRKVVRVVYNVLTEQYDEIELGDIRRVFWEQ